MIKIGCQRITWSIQDGWGTSAFTDVVPAMAALGYSGVEAFTEDVLNYEGRESELRDLAKANGLTLTTAYYGTDFCDPAKVGNEIEGALKLASCLAKAGCQMIVLGTGGKGTTDENYKSLLDALNTLGKEVAERYRIKTAIHTHFGSMVETREQLARLMDGTDPDFVFFVPDSGHLVRGGVDLNEAIETYFDRIAYVHYKDVDAEGNWRLLGEGMIDHAATTDLLVGKGYNGWIIAEEEDPDAIKNLGAAACARKNIECMKKMLQR